MPSPAHRQYLAIKERYPDAVLLYRLGDFYEMFEEDAEMGARILGITLTSREFGKGDRVAMCGIPHHALHGHLRRFVEHGVKVAICEQLSEPGKGLVERDVVRVVTPGTLVEPALLDARANNYLAAVTESRGRYGLAYVDVTTGEFAVTEFVGEDAPARLEIEMLRLAPAECIVPRADLELELPGQVTVFDDFRFDTDSARAALCRHLGVLSLEGFGCEGMPAGIGAAGAIIAYLERSHRALLGLLTTLRTYHVSAFMELDRYTLRNLELMEGARSRGARATLLWVLDRTETAMGGRLLRRMLASPLLAVEPLERRLDAVDELYRLAILRGRLRDALGGMADLERLVGRVQTGLATAADLLSLRASLAAVCDLSALLKDSSCAELDELRERLDPCPEVIRLIESAVAEGEGTIKPGYSPELDGMVESIRASREWIARLEPVERERTGIRSLKVGFNKVFGYYIEVSNANRETVPPEYIRKQTLVNAERYITPELKEREAQILQAEERITALEHRIFQDLLGEIARAGQTVTASALAVAQLDVYRSLADVAARRGYVRPRLCIDQRLEIKAGRHPVVEATLEDHGFIANDCLLDCEGPQVMVITGPNMGGKSTYLRQVALIVLMAQIGSFVPADDAHIGIVDRIFTRVGAQDDIASGQSTFMVEMVETANILNHATSRSLLLVDEIGRGTSTYDGFAIARAVLEYIHDHVGARTLFATHYHELTGAATGLSRVENAHAAVTEDGADVIFLHRLVPGAADRSYGVHVARLAGLPAEVTRRAAEALDELESNPATVAHSHAQQIPLFSEVSDGRAEQVLRQILGIDLERMTPLEALTLLHDLQRRGRGEMHVS